LALGVATHRHLPAVGSTNSWAAAYVAGDAAVALPLLVTCDHQAAGRGRGERRWQQQIGGLAFSVVIDIGPQPGETAAWSTARQALPLWTAVCLQETAAHYLPAHRCQLKWPNDLMIDDRKNAGILLETVPGQSQRVIVGVGVNINNSLAQDSLTLAREGFSWSETRQVYSLPEVLGEFLRRWLPMAVLTPDQLAGVLTKFAAVDWLRGKSIGLQSSAAWWRTPSGELCLLPAMTDGSVPREFRGTYRGLSPEGYLQLAEATGRSLVFPTAEHVRPLS